MKFRFWQNLEGKIKTINLYALKKSSTLVFAKANSSFVLINKTPSFVILFELKLHANTLW